MRFDIENVAWAANMAIGHHEGMVRRFEVDSGVCQGVQLDQVVGLVVKNDVVQRTWPRRLAILPKDGKSWLVVTTADRPVALLPASRNEGQVLTWDTRSINGLGDFGAQASALYTLTYDLTDPNLGTSFTINHNSNVETGGAELCVFPGQAAPPGQFDLFVGNTAGDTVFFDPVIYPEPPDTPLNATSRLRIDTVTFHAAIDQYVRNNDDRKGRWAHSIGYFHERPELLVLAFNDAGINGEGVSALCDNPPRFESSFYAPGSLGDDQGSFGLFFNPDSQWPFAAETGCSSGGAWVWGGHAGSLNKNGTPGDESDDYFMQWRLGKYCYGTSACPFEMAGDSRNPSELDAWILNGTPDRLEHTGGGYFGGTVVPAYDVEHDQASQGWEIAFGTRTVTTEGVTVVRRDRVEAHAQANPDDEWFHLNDPLVLAELSHLVTHPEYDNVPANPQGSKFLGPGKSGISGSCRTWSPELFKLDSPTNEPTWVMAVPCGSVFFPPEVDARYDELWDPDPIYLTNHARLMVRFWNIQNPPLLDEGQPNHDPFAEILGTDYPNSHAIVCRAVEDEGRVLLFVADHGARILVYDVTDWLHTPPANPTPLATWAAPLSLTDELTNNIRSMAIDHAVWSDGPNTYDEIYVYAAVWRVGIQILRFSWGNGDCQCSLVPLQLIQTPSYCDWVHMRDAGGGEKTLLVSDSIGVRAYSYNP